MPADAFDTLPYDLYEAKDLLWLKKPPQRSGPFAVREEDPWRRAREEIRSVALQILANPQVVIWRHGATPAAWRELRAEAGWLLLRAWKQQGFTVPGSRRDANIFRPALVDRLVSDRLDVPVPYWRQPYRSRSGRARQVKLLGQVDLSAVQALAWEAFRTHQTIPSLEGDAKDANRVVGVLLEGGAPRYLGRYPWRHDLERQVHDGIRSAGVLATRFTKDPKHALSAVRQAYLKPLARLRSGSALDQYELLRDYRMQSVGVLTIRAGLDTVEPILLAMLGEFARQAVHPASGPDREIAKDWHDHQDYPVYDLLQKFESQWADDLQARADRWFSRKLANGEDEPERGRPRPSDESEE